ncbi:cysteine proteinase [Linnemannia elongata AG-77]|uniref:Cysteine proteinase n=1 Tax=Linnemannia elongata AG-77 TaxID=1314771 RepID=A0A197JVV4_9FUNG|nr:cysteine proteinase [Linnemannia elongata AG-77]
MNPQDHDPQQFQDLAQQLARQFVTMRQQRTNNATPSQSTNESANAGTSEITNLAKQLGGLLNARETSKHAPTQEENDAFRITTAASMPSATSATSTIEVAGSAAHDFDSIPDPSMYEADFVNIFKGINASVLRFEERELLDLASDQMPIGRFFEEAEAMADEFPDDNIDDIVIRRLLHWFKNEYFTWVNQPPCTRCEASTTSIGGVAPSAQERLQGAGMVETYKCTAPDCHQITRFPRYGGMPKILFETRRGRCGEWANCFTVCCRALGYKARFVHDTTDHVWTEVWSEHKGRWIHCDSCEAAYDQPLLYTTGWGKTLSYCVSFSAEEVVDVTRRYTVDYDTVVVKRRRSIRELVFEKFLHRLSESNLSLLDLKPEEVLAIRQRQALERDDLYGKNGDCRAIETKDRQSGSDEWTKARGERK